MGFRIEKGKSQFILEDTGKFTVAPAALACPRPTHVFHNPLGRPVRLTGSPDSGGYHTGCRGDSVTLRSPGNTPLGRTVGLVAQPAGTTRRDTCRAYVLRPRTSCGDTNGSTLHVAKQVRGIQNPQSCRQAHRISRFPSAPFLHLNRPDSLVFRLPTPSALLLVR